MSNLIRFNAIGRPVVSSTTELQKALAAGHDPDKIVVEAAADVEGMQALVSSANTERDTARADAAQARADLAAGQQKWDSERTAMVAAALEMKFPDQTAVIVKAERERISALLTMRKAGFEKLSDEAIANGSTIEQYALAQIRAEADRGITLDQIRRDAPQPAAHATPPSTDKQQQGKSWDHIVPKDLKRM